MDDRELLAMLLDMRTVGANHVSLAQRKRAVMVLGKAYMEYGLQCVLYDVEKAKAEAAAEAAKVVAVTAARQASAAKLAQGKTPSACDAVRSGHLYGVSAWSAMDMDNFFTESDGNTTVDMTTEGNGTTDASMPDVAIAAPAVAAPAVVAPAVDGLQEDAAVTLEVLEVPGGVGLSEVNVVVERQRLADEFKRVFQTWISHEVDWKKEFPEVKFGDQIDIVSDLLQVDIRRLYLGLMSEDPQKKNGVHPLYLIPPEDPSDFERLFAPGYERKPRQKSENHNFRSIRTPFSGSVGQDGGTTFLRSSSEGTHLCPPDVRKPSRILRIEELEIESDSALPSFYPSEESLGKRTPTSSLMLNSKNKNLCATEEDELDIENFKKFLWTFPEECHQVVKKLYKLRLALYFKEWRSRTVVLQGELSGRAARRKVDMVRRRFYQGFLKAAFHDWCLIILRKNERKTRTRRWLKELAAAPVQVVVRSGLLFVLKTMVNFIGPEAVEDFKNWRDDSDKTLIHVAAEGGHVKMIKFLQEAFEIDPRAKDRNGRSPFHVACRNKHRKAAELLTLLGCDPVTPDRDGTVYTDFVNAPH
ncbi:hypothetical protein CYMTET_26365 [Cymbomonas tetramitiformis]|uniref:Uncharacterized protein n=1 Tax=Cymbomonas tetramitiformis TaxID=36881 RepID=A0AAE0FS91_9CHLO|nr:hypothetical protein CYMTET_26365 [Cymbomonas tetramitiformis]